MKLKICGMKEQADLSHAAELGFDFCGFIFHEKSPRNIQPERAAGLETGKMRRIGVFVNQKAEEINGIMRLARLDFAQLHGSQSSEDIRAIGPGRVIRVLWPARYATVRELEAEAERYECALFLLDSGASGGGSGTRIDWKALAGLKLPAPWILAGGLGPGNLAEALSLCKPWGLDFNSGVEDGPGIKNHAKMLAAVRAARQETKI